MLCAWCGCGQRWTTSIDMVEASPPHYLNCFMNQIYFACIVDWFQPYSLDLYIVSEMLQPIWWPSILQNNLNNWITFLSSCRLLLVQLYLAFGGRWSCRLAHGKHQNKFMARTAWRCSLAKQRYMEFQLSIREELLNCWQRVYHITLGLLFIIISKPLSPNIATKNNSQMLCSDLQLSVFYQH